MLHDIHVTSDGLTNATKIYIDGVELKGCTKLTLVVDAEDPIPKLRIELVANRLQVQGHKLETEIVGEAPAQVSSTVDPEPRCTGHLVHDEYTACPKHDR